MYYVDPDSTQNMELGTMDYPFRDINLVLIEIHNVHQHTDRNISVYTMEATDNYLPLDSIELLTVSQVSFDTYTQKSLNEAHNTNFIVSDNQFNVSIEKALFNIIQNTTKGVSDTSRMDETEQAEFNLNTNIVFRVHRSSINFNHISIHSRLINNINVFLVYTSF